MEKYTQLSLEHRHKIQALLDAGHNQSVIAQTIGVHRSTISHELARNIPSGGKDYRAETAQQLTDQPHTDKPKHRRFSDDLKAQARQWLTTEGLSPELISGQWQVKGIDGVSHETLYQWIWTAKHTGDPENKNHCKDLKHGAGKRRCGNRSHSRGTIKGRTSIDQRPDVVGERSRLRDIEVDLMVGKNHKSALLAGLTARGCSPSSKKYPLERPNRWHRASSHNSRGSPRIYQNPDLCG